MKQVLPVATACETALTPWDIKLPIVPHRGVNPLTNLWSIGHPPTLVNSFLIDPLIIPLLPPAMARAILEIIPVPPVGLTINMSLFVIPRIPIYLSARLRFTSIILKFGICPVILTEVLLIIRFNMPFDPLVRNNFITILGPLPLPTTPIYPCV